MVRTVNAIDHSKWQCDDWTESSALAYRNMRYSVAWPGTWHGSDHNPCAKSNLQYYQAEGWETGTYIVVGYDTMPRMAVDTAFDVLGKQVWDGLRFVAIDLESQNSVHDVLEMEAAIIAKGQRPCLYTANWVFQNGLVSGDHNRLHHLPLIYAAYGLAPSLVPTGQYVEHMVKFDKVVGHQYRNTHKESTATFAIDSTILDEEWLEDDSWRRVDETRLVALERRVRALETHNYAAAICRKAAAAYEAGETPDKKTAGQIKWLLKDV